MEENYKKIGMVIFVIILGVGFMGGAFLMNGNDEEIKNINYENNDVEVENDDEIDEEDEEDEEDVDEEDEYNFISENFYVEDNEQTNEINSLHMTVKIEEEVNGGVLEKEHKVWAQNILNKEMDVRVESIQIIPPISEELFLGKDIYNYNDQTMYIGQKNSMSEEIEWFYDEGELEGKDFLIDVESLISIAKYLEEGESIEGKNQKIILNSVDENFEDNLFSPPTDSLSPHRVF